MVKCPQCSKSVAELVPLDIEIRTQLDVQKISYASESVCRDCASNLRRQSLGYGGVLLAEEKAKEERKNKLWGARISLVKQGNAFMQKRLYSEAAVTYEKYLKLLEIVFGADAGSLNPEALKDSAKTAELTIIAGVYWDLVRIYDTNDIYSDRQRNAATQLARFVTLTPIYSDIMKKAAVFQRSAKHPDVISIFLSSAQEKRPRCFIATSAFESPLATEVQTLRIYRDTVLKNTFWGRKLIFFYYKHSQSVACFLDKHTALKPLVRAILRAVINCVS